MYICCVIKFFLKEEIFLIEELTNENLMTGIYNMIAKYHEKYLKNFGVTLPELFRSDNYTKSALVLIYLAYGYPNTRIVTKHELTEYVEHFHGRVNDVQQARHLGAQGGWYILSGGRKDINTFCTQRF